MTTTTPRDRVLAGAAWLDIQIPDWRERVVINDLQMDDTCRCILGQVFQPEARADGMRREDGTGRAFAFWYVIPSDWNSFNLREDHVYLLTKEESMELGFDRLPWEGDDDEDYGIDPAQDYDELRDLWTKLLAGQEI